MTDKDSEPIVKKGKRKESSEEDDEKNNDGEYHGYFSHNRGGFGEFGKEPRINQGSRGIRGVPRGGFRGHVE